MVEGATVEPMADEERASEPESLPNHLHATPDTVGRRGGKKNGKVRAAKLTPEHRTEIALIAASIRCDGTQKGVIKRSA